MCALLDRDRVITEYQLESSSKRPEGSVAFASRVSSSHLTGASGRNSCAHLTGSFHINEMRFPASREDDGDALALSSSAEVATGYPREIPAPRTGRK